MHDVNYFRISSESDGYGCVQFLQLIVVFFLNVYDSRLDIIFFRLHFFGSELLDYLILNTRCVAQSFFPPAQVAMRCTLFAGLQFLYICF